VRECSGPQTRDLDVGGLTTGHCFSAHEAVMCNLISFHVLSMTDLWRSHDLNVGGTSGAR